MLINSPSPVRIFPYFSLFNRACVIFSFKSDLQNLQFETSPFLSEVPKFSQKSFSKATSLPFIYCVFFLNESEENQDSRKFNPSAIILLQCLRKPRLFSSSLPERICTSSDDGKDKYDMLFSIKENISSSFSSTSTRFLNFTER